MWVGPSVPTSFRVPCHAGIHISRLLIIPVATSPKQKKTENHKSLSNQTTNKNKRNKRSPARKEQTPKPYTAPLSILSLQPPTNTNPKKKLPQKKQTQPLPKQKNKLKHMVVDLNSFHPESAFSRDKNYFREPHV